MSEKEYEQQKLERDRKDKKASMIIFPLMLVILVGCIGLILLYG